MKKITGHIEKLLREHDCVIVPGLGGFLVNHESGQIVAERSLFIPPTKTIGFNVLLTHNDGLLAQSVMKTEGLSYEQAKKLISQEVDNLFLHLKSERMTDFGNLGKLFLNNSDKIIFEPNDFFVLSVENYGLSKVYFSPLRKEKKIKISKTESFQKILWGSVAALLFLLLFPVNIFDGKQDNMSQASIFSINLKESNKEISNSLSTDSVQTEVSNITLDSVNYTITLSTEKEQSIVQNEQELANPEKTYHIIIASLPNYALAEKYIEEATSFPLDSMSIVEKDNRCRISVKKYADKFSAESYLKGFKKENPNFSSAWILDVVNN